MVPCIRWATTRQCTPVETRNYIYKFTDGNSTFNTLGAFQGIAYWMDYLQVADDNSTTLPRCDPMCNRWEYVYQYDAPQMEFLDGSYSGISFPLHVSDVDE